MVDYLTYLEDWVEPQALAPEELAFTHPFSPTRSAPDMADNFVSQD
jgi:hypothetical protein